MLYPDESYQVIGACFEVHNRMGCGFLEPVYQEYLALELEHRRISFVAQPKLELLYRERALQQIYKPAFVIEGTILVEIKSVSQLVDKHEAQVINYLHATGLQPGILVNFGSHPKLESKRLALTLS